MHRETSSADPLAERRIAWRILQGSPSVRLLGSVGWPYPCPAELKSADGAPEHSATEAFKSNRVHHRARSEEELEAARSAGSDAARKAHLELAQLHSFRALGSSRVRRRIGRKAVNRREVLLDDALDNSFPASDPPAFVAPGRAERFH